MTGGRIGSGSLGASGEWMCERELAFTLLSPGQLVLVKFNLVKNRAQRA